MTKKGDFLLSFDMHNGFYALGINHADRDYITVNVRGLPTCMVTYGVVPILHIFLQNDPSLCEFHTSTRPRTTLPGIRQLHEDLPQKNASILPYVDEFLLFAASHEDALI
jgi:hypothetical protein